MPLRVVQRLGLLFVCAAVVVNCGSQQARNDAPVKEETPSPTPVGGGAPDPTAVLLEAAFVGRTELVREALEHGAEASAKGDDGRSALMLAAFDGHTETLRALLKGGARVDDRDGSGRTALMYAASGPFPESVRLLLEWGADPQAVDEEERFTALMFAAAEGQAAVVGVLLEHGADRDKVDGDGETALNFATQKGHEEVVRMLSDEK